MMDAIEAAEAEVERLQARLADPATYQGDGDDVASLKTGLEAAEAESLRLTERWEELEAVAAAHSAR